jgi:hypothetical protein
VVELRTVIPTVVAVLASTAALDGLSIPEGATLCRVAPREALVIGGGGLTPAGVGMDGGAALIEDVTDGWAAFELTGDDAPEAFARLSELDLPREGFVQGDVVRIGSKVLSAPGRLTILVPASLGAFVEERIRVDCAELLA